MKLLNEVKRDTINIQTDRQNYRVKLHICTEKISLFIPLSPILNSQHCTENSKKIFPEMKLRGLAFPISTFMYL
jgi:hypothetical protein